MELSLQIKYQQTLSVQQKRIMDLISGTEIQKGRFLSMMEIIVQRVQISFTKMRVTRLISDLMPSSQFGFLLIFLKMLKQVHILFT